MATLSNKRHFLSEGKLVEEAFSELFNTPEFASKQEDINEHWDVKFETKVDVKGLKRVSRADDEVNENIHYLEIKNVNGKLGWVYGEANYFVFETKSYWIVVSKERLQEFIKNTVSKEFVERPEPYKLYQRKGRKDVLTLVSTIDLCYLSSSIIKKN